MTHIKKLALYTLYLVISQSIFSWGQGNPPATLSYSNGILQNQYFTMDTGNVWNGIDPILNDTDLVTAAALFHDDLMGQMTVIPMYDSYLTNVVYLDDMLENIESASELLGDIIKKEYFLTNQGSQAFALHYTFTISGLKNYYAFGIDGTTSGYQGNTSNWLYFPITITNSSLSYQEALNIAKSVVFTEGTPTPAKSMSEFDGLSPGQSVPIAYVPPSGSDLSYSNGILQNQYFTMDTGNVWNGIDPILNDTDLVTSASLIHDDLMGQMMVLPMYDTYMTNVMYLDYMLENIESASEILGDIIKKEYFLTNQGSQAFALHYTVSTLGVTQNYYAFGIDGTTSGYQGNTSNWLYFPITITNSSLSYQEALNIAKSVVFTEGTPTPAKSMSEFDGLSPGQSVPIAYVPPSGSSLSYSSGILQNQYFTMDTGNVWNGITPVLTDSDLITSASFIHDDFMGQMMVIPIYDTYMTNSMYLDFMLDNVESTTEILGDIIKKEYFLTNQGSQAFALHYTVSILGVTQNYYAFGIDGTTSGYQGNTSNWLYFPITITNSSLSYQEALNIAKSVVFTEGTPTPAKSMSEFDGLSPGQSVPIAYVPPFNGVAVANNWFESTWFGIFYDIQNGWVYHVDLGWIYLKAKQHNGWCWLNNKDWIWISEDTYPYLYSDNTKDWVYLSFSEQDLTKAYDFSNESWSDWSDLVLNKTNTSTTQNSSGEEAKAIEEIYYSDSMSEEEKIDAIGNIILFGL